MLNTRGRNIIAYPNPHQGGATDPILHIKQRKLRAVKWLSGLLTVPPAAGSELHPGHG